MIRFVCFSGVDGGAKAGHGIQKIFAVFSKMVDAPLSPTTSTSKLVTTLPNLTEQKARPFFVKLSSIFTLLFHLQEDFAAKTPEREKDVLKEG